MGIKKIRLGREQRTRQQRKIWKRQTGLAFVLAALVSGGSLLSCSSTPTKVRTTAVTLDDQDAREKNPRERALLLVEAAAASLREKDTAGAFQFLGRAEASGIDLPETHHTRGLAHLALGQMELAAESVRKAVKRDPAYSDAWNTLGRILLDQGKVAEAEIVLKNAIQDPAYRDLYKPYTNLGIIEYQRGKYAVARKQFEQATKVGLFRACHAHYYLGHLAMRRGDYAESSEHYRDATKNLCAGFKDAHFAVGVAFERLKATDKAKQKYLEITRSFPGTDVARNAFERMKYLQ